MRRISIIGTSGSGKTTLGRALALRLDIPHFELDELNWGPNWTEVPAEIFASRVAAAVNGDAWTMCGNYGKVRQLVMDRADTIIWLDYPLGTILLRLVRRTILRCCTRQELWAGNRERLFTQLFTRQSLILWVLTTWRRRRRDYPIMLRQQKTLGKRIVRLRTPQQAQRWLDRFGI